jgi:hypothetical protein
MKLHKPYQRTNYVKHSLSNKGVDIWNNLDPNFTEKYSILLYIQEKIEKILHTVAY